MKEVMAIIRLNQVNQTKEALLEAGFPSLTCRKVLGRGKKKVPYSLIQNLPQEPVGPRFLEEISEEHRFVPKRLITLVVHDQEVEKVVASIIQANQTGHPGDGKIFVLPIFDAYSIRTGQSGDEAI